MRHLALVAVRTLGERMACQRIMGAPVPVRFLECRRFGLGIVDSFSASRSDERPADRAA